MITPWTYFSQLVLPNSFLSALPIFSKNDFKNVFGGAQAGAGFDLFMFSFDARYEISLNDLSNSGFLTNTRSNQFLFTIGWKIL